MAAAQEALNSALDTVQWFQTPHSLVANVDGEVHNNEADWNDLLRRQLTNPVQFLDATLALPTSIETTVEMPPGNVLTGLTKRIRPFAHQFVIDGPESALGVEL
jgi:malonyl CoA-acyl carrier protein transacylase